MKDFTLVSTTFNEISRLELTIEDIENQTYKPSQVVIADAGSNDGTYERLVKWQKESNLSIKVLSKAKINVAEGRNWAIKNSSFDLIASTDFGCRFHKDWLKSIIQPFDDPKIKVVGGGYTVKEEDIRTLAARANYVLSSGYTSVMDEYFIPSSRSIAYYKEVWSDAGEYPEWLTLAADDLVFGKVLLSKGYNFHLMSNPYVYWGRHTTQKAYAREAYRYGLGDGEASVNLKQFIKAILEKAARLFFLLALIIAVPVIFLSELSPIYIVLLAPLAWGFKPYLLTYEKWLIFKSEKYNLKVLLYSFYLLEVSNWNYIKGHFMGLFFSKPEQKKQASKLKKILNDKH